MKIDISEITGGTKKELFFDYPLTIGEAFYGVTFPEPMGVHGEIRNAAGYISLKVKADITYDTYCDRCQKPIKASLSLDFTRTLVNKGSLANVDCDDNIDYIELEDDHTLDIDETVREEFVLSFPMKHLCREDCKGLCAGCGADLNVSECRCKKEKTSSVWDEAIRKLSEDSNNK